MSDEQQPSQDDERSGGSEHSEQARLEDLRELAILDTEPEPEFDALVDTASAIAGTPLAIMTLIDSDRVWFKASKGVGETEAPRETSFCEKVIEHGGEPLLIQDTSADPEWADHPMVTGPPHISFYAGFPILSDRENIIGSLCVLDQEPHTLTEDQVRALVGQARQAGAMLALRRERKTVSDRLEGDGGRVAGGRDQLTGLLNREGLEKAIREQTGSDASGQVGVIVVDLMRFSEVNALLGRDGGDEVIRQAVEKVADSLPSRDLLARIGGTTFAVMLPEAEGHQVTRTARTVLDALAQPIDLANREPVMLAVAAGFSVSPPAGEISPKNLLSSAELASADAKRAGPGSLVEAKAGERRSGSQLTRAKAALARAIEDDELAVAYMPIVNLASGAQVGSEALLRWPKASTIGISVEEMVTMAEEEGLISRVDDFVLARALEDFAAGRLGGHEVSVNLSPAGVTQDLPGRISGMLDRLDLEPGNLMIEVTERVILGGNEELLQVMEELGEIGVGLAIDDFGAGVTSISDLQKLPFDRVKIDRALTRDVGRTDEERAAKVVGAVVSLAEALGAETVAEGVEEEFQRQALAEIGVDNGQGYLFGRAAPIGFRTPEEDEVREAVTAAILDDVTASFFDQTTDLACIDSGGKLLKVNSNFTKVLGWTEADLLAGNFIDFVHPEDRARTEETLSFLRPDRPLEGFENRLLTTEGNYRTIVWSARMDPATGLALANGRDVTEERQVEASRDRLREVVTALSVIEQDYIQEGPSREWWRRTLDQILDISDSPYGFLGTVGRDGDGNPYLKVRAFSDIAWNEWSREIYDRFLEEGGVEFRNMETLFGRSVTSGKRLISEDVTTDPRGSGFPGGHPALGTYAGIPLKTSEGVVGMVGLANRQSGYTEDFLDQLDVVFNPLAEILAKEAATGRLEQVEEASVASVNATERILACNKFDHALAVAGEFCASAIPGSETDFFVTEPTGAKLTRYGESGEPMEFARQDCLALNRGEPHLSDRRRDPEDRCRHVPEGKTVVCLPVESQGEEFGVLVVTESDGGAAEQAGSLPDLLSSLRSVANALAQVARRDQLVYRSLTDPLTGLPNREALIRSVNRSLVKVGETGRPFGVLELDLDHFKPVNDDLGHKAGDHLLGEVGLTIRGALRQADLVCRLGGDEFGILVPEIDRDLLIEAAERVRRAIAAIEIPGGHRVTASIGGVVVTGPDTDWERIYEVVDAKLYEVKHSGRDRVEVAEQPLGG